MSPQDFQTFFRNRTVVAAATINWRPSRPVLFTSTSTLEGHSPLLVTDMGKKKVKKSFVSPTQLLAESFDQVTNDDSKKSMLESISSRIEDEVRKQLIDFVTSIDDEITRVRSHFLDLKLMIPPKLRELTVGEIVSASGSFELQDNDDNLVVNVPTELFGDPAVADSLASSLMIINSAKKGSRPVLNDATNSVRRTGLRSTIKRSRIPTGMTPASSKRGKNTSIGGNVSGFMAPSTARVTRSTARKVAPAKAHTKPSVIAEPLTAGVVNTPKNVKNALEGTTYQVAVINNVTINNITSQNGSDAHIVNPKTPGGNNLFRKMPRVPDPGEEMNIVVYSNQGTPLVVDPVEAIARKQSAKSITNK